MFLEEEVNQTHVDLVRLSTTLPAWGTKTTTLGWGTTKNGRQSKVKQQLDLTLQSNAYCQMRHDKVSRGQDSEITPAMICAGGQDGEDACYGDSGGPLVVYDPQTRLPTLVGVVSWSQGCGKPRLPGVYARVDQVLEWIEMEMDVNP